MAEPMVYRRLRAPTADGDVLLDPPSFEIPALVESNVARRRINDECELDGRFLKTITDFTRALMVDAARRHTQQYADVSWVDERLASRRIYLVGHQPELFHPGVWLKNFVVDALAKRDGALAVHVLIDNDETPPAAIRVPTGSLEDPRVATVAFDSDAPPSAWEERAVNDAAMLRSFAQRATNAIAPLVENPLVATMWRDIDAVLDSSQSLGGALAQLRHRLEIAWGVQTLEVPLSAIVDQGGTYLAAFILSELPRFHEVHNAALDEFRAVHKLRSSSQPLPDLAERDGWLEAPFWVWTDKDPTRRKLFVKRESGTWWLRDGIAGANTWTINVWQNPTFLMFETLPGLQREGVKIRPRALVTTMMLRLLASDLFIHGIGGAKYDQVTDRIIADFFGIEPPGFLTATGTRLLPLPHTSVAAEDMQQIDKLLRELRYRPEDHLNVADRPTGERLRIEQLVAEKRRWLRQEVAPGQLAERHAALAEINAELENYVSTRRNELTAERLRIETELKRQAILGSREFSFCLYPADTLRAWLLGAAAHAL